MKKDIKLPFFIMGFKFCRLVELVRKESELVVEFGSEITGLTES